MHDITHGEWGSEPTDPGHSGSFYEPPDPGHRAIVYSEIPVWSDYYGQTVTMEVPIATMDEPRYPDENGQSVVVGDMDVNARFMSLAPQMYRKLLAVSDAMTQCGYDQPSATDDPPGSPWHGLYSGINELLVRIRGEG